MKPIEYEIKGLGPPVWGGYDEDTSFLTPFLETHYPNTEDQNRALAEFLKARADQHGHAVLRAEDLRVLAEIISPSSKKTGPKADPNRSIFLAEAWVHLWKIKIREGFRPGRKTDRLVTDEIADGLKWAKMPRKGRPVGLQPVKDAVAEHKEWIEEQQKNFLNK
ncbi:MAG: hypothetical protein EOM25_14935 [Deltaproteobacteria bacterium]|nr:hypothetical protein [Deltaproteobacteria bacterium]